MNKKITTGKLDRVKLLIEVELGTNYQFMLSIVSPEGKISMVGHGRSDSLAPALEYSLNRVQLSSKLKPTVPGLPRGRLQ